MGRQHNGKRLDIHCDRGVPWTRERRPWAWEVARSSFWTIWVRSSRTCWSSSMRDLRKSKMAGSRRRLAVEEEAVAAAPSAMLVSLSMVVWGVGGKVGGARLRLVVGKGFAFTFSARREMVDGRHASKSSGASIASRDKAATAISSS